VGTAFVLKPFYMILTCHYLLRFRKAKVPEISMAWWALFWFLGGEVACGLNYVFYDTEYSWIQMSHDVGMVMTFALLARTATLVLDWRVLNYSSTVRRCALLGVCRSCVKYRPGPCLLSSAQPWLIGALSLLFILPLTIPVQPVRYETEVFGFPTVLEHGYLAQVVEIRILPILGLLPLGAAAWMGSQLGAFLGVHFLTALALGPGGFSMMRVITAFPFLGAIVWMGFWEEASETAMVWLVGRWMAAWSGRLEGVQLDVGTVDPPARSDE
jgi:hypothetical protein